MHLRQCSDHLSDINSDKLIIKKYKKICEKLNRPPGFNSIDIKTNKYKDFRKYNARSFQKSFEKKTTTDFFPQKTMQNFNYSNKSFKVNQNSFFENISKDKQFNLGKLNKNHEKYVEILEKIKKEFEEKSKELLKKNDNFQTNPNSMIIKKILNFLNLISIKFQEKIQVFSEDLGLIELFFELENLIFKCFFSFLKRECFSATNENFFKTFNSNLEKNQKNISLNDCKKCKNIEIKQKQLENTLILENSKLKSEIQILNKKFEEIQNFGKSEDIQKKFELFQKEKNHELEELSKYIVSKDKEIYQCRLSLGYINILF